MHIMQTNTTNQTMNPSSRTQLRIASLGMVMDDLDQTEEWGSRLYRVLETYQHLLLRQYSKIPTSQFEREEMKAAIHELDECFHALNEEPSMAGWFYGIDTGDNTGYGLAHLLITARNELLFEIAITIRH